jgi:Zinc dependent phospholipase C
MKSFFLRWSALLLLLTGAFQMCAGYSVLTHEQVVDLLWNDQIRPLLLKRFPGSTEQDLRKAHAYAYGGSMLQDMGYYPFGNKYFSDLVHYVRSGDFVQNLIEESSDLKEYAFALGALAHYVSDTTGHPAVNQIVALEFPRLERKHGRSVTYADNPKAHIQAEFGLDMVQVAKNRFTSDTYHDFIGFEVSTPVLQRAFAKTYGLSIDDVFSDLDLAIGSYRRSISKVIPAMTRAALHAHKEELVRETPNFNKKKFLYYLSRSDYEHEWGTTYRKPGCGARILAFFLEFVPKVGPFRALAFKTPSQHGEDMYIKSVDETVEHYKHVLVDTKQDRLDLPNLDFDTGRETRGGEYVLTDKTYARLLDELAQKDFKPVSPELRSDILRFYADAVAPIATAQDQEAWSKTEEELAKLRALAPEELTPQKEAKPAGDPGNANSHP